MDSALQLFANAGDGVFAVDHEQRILFWSKLAKETLGYTAKDAVGQYCWQLIDGKNKSGFQICSPDCPIFLKIQEKQPVKPFDLIVKDNANKPVTLNMSSIGLPINGDEIFGLIHIQREV